MSNNHLQACYQAILRQQAIMECKIHMAKYKTPVVRILVFAVCTLLLSVNAGAAARIHYVINDHLGTPQMLLDQNQNVVWKAEYDEFGHAHILVEEIEFNPRFPGQYYDKETGLNYNYYRDYDPRLGRYVQSDPIGILKSFNDPSIKTAMKLGLPLNPGGSSFSGPNHVYSYVENNPIRYIDPFGLVGTLNSDNSKQCASSDCGMYGGTEPSNATATAMQCPAFPPEDPHKKCKMVCMIVTTTCGLTDGPIGFMADMACGAYLGTKCFNWCEK